MIILGAPAPARTRRKHRDSDNGWEYEEKLNEELALGLGLGLELKGNDMRAWDADDCRIDDGYSFDVQRHSSLSPRFHNKLRYTRPWPNMLPPIPRRLTPILAFLTLLFVLYTYRDLFSGNNWRSLPLEKIGLGDEKTGDDITTKTGGSLGAVDDILEDATGLDVIEDGSVGGKQKPSVPYGPGAVKPAGSSYSKMVVIARTKKEDVSWLDGAFKPESGIKSTIYVADDPNAPYHPPQNKGHEVMIYLTYIIDHYDKLADVSIFMHAHRIAWHNNIYLEKDAVKMITRLSSERVHREGYMNMRCHWSPGCPDWMHPGAIEEDVNKQEETLLAASWSELFPLDPIPQVLAQPCCAQFALSRDRIHALPKSKYIFYRDWLIRTPLSDYISGRVWEYIWHYLFTRNNVYCPAENVCYCDGFGVCFGSEPAYGEYFERMGELNHLQDELAKWHQQDDAIRVASEQGHGKIDEGKALAIPEFGKDVEMAARIEELRVWIAQEFADALERGTRPENRAKEAGRPWVEGDGF